jgi:hypothetical protein
MSLLPSYSELKTSTETYMVYTNVTFNIHSIFENINVLSETPEKYDGKKKINGNDIKGYPLGTIVTAQLQKQVKGIQQMKRKRKTTQKNTKKELSFFLNQISLHMYIGSPIIPNAMIFKNSLKVVGCKSLEQITQFIQLLWNEHIEPFPNLWTMKEGHESEKPKFCFTRVMKNVDCRLGYPINLNILDQILSDEKYSDVVTQSFYDSTNQPNVNIKLCPPIERNLFHHLIELENTPTVKKVNGVIPYVKPKPYKKNVTVIVFATSEIILSGRDDDEMNWAYDFFINISKEYNKKMENYVYPIDYQKIVDVLS